MVFINHDKKFVFIHIPKTGGMTIKNTLEYNKINNDMYNDDIHNPYTYDYYQLCKHNVISNYFFNKIICIPYHFAIDDVKNIYKQNFENYFKFTFVRNPYDKVFSTYLYLKSDKPYSLINSFFFHYLFYVILISFILKNKIRQIFVFINLIIFLYLTNIRIKLTKNFDSFLKNIEYIRVFFNFAYKSQNEYVKNNNFDFIGKQETFDSDFKYILKKLDLKMDIKNKNIINKNNFSEYKYTNKYTKEQIKIINEIYHDDFINFGYKKL
tara:strand:- start:16 stop:816 length:801 start_codon:yes stop_codon:yes gene_type:complete